MILNEDYFDDIEITDDDIESSKEDSADVILKYDKPSDWFTNEINGKYFACLYIPVDKKNYNKWK